MAISKIGSNAVDTLSKKLVLTAADGVADNDYIMDIQNAEATDGRNFGLRIKAGSNASDYGFVLADHDGSNTRIISYGNGYTAFLANAASNNAFKIANDGNNNNRYGLEVHCGADDASGTNYAITFHDGDGTAQGIITFSSGTVTYGAFTAHHEISLPDADKSDGYDYGTLVEIDDIYYTQKNGADTERGIRYLVKKSQGAYSKKVLGAYCGDMLLRADTDGTYKDNLHQCAILGDGHIICNGEKGNISIGDGICSSSTNGVGMKADKLSMIIGIAQKDITFSSASETKLVPVQYGVRQFTPWTD